MCLEGGEVTLILSALSPPSSRTLTPRCWWSSTRTASWGRSNGARSKILTTGTRASTSTLIPQHQRTIGRAAGQLVVPAAGPGAV